MSINNERMAQNVENFYNQLSIARTEIKNLRVQIYALKHAHLKEVKAIKNLLGELRCTSCADEATTLMRNQAIVQETYNPNGGCIPFRPIGVIRTSFHNKRGVPRQASLVSNSKGLVEIYTWVFNNPEHAMNGLEEFSHMWIMFHFHVTESTSVPAKVAPPRLCGEKRGVFSTRSPHRPCPIGLSLVKITKIEDNKIHFLGVDMVNGTPVLDVKPYIPHYDSPSSIGDLNDRPPTEGVDDGTEAVNVNIDDEDISIGSRVTIPIDSLENNSTSAFQAQSSARTVEGTVNEAGDQDLERGAPDGQEHFMQSTSTDQTVRIAPWINNPPSQVYEVIFTTEAFDRLKDLIGDRAESFKTNIQSLLCDDPRSEYVRSRYPDHEFSCVLEDLSISCMFDAGTSVCTIIAIRSAEEMQN